MGRTSSNFETHKNRLLELNAAGKSVAQIAEMINEDRANVYNWLKKLGIGKTKTRVVVEKRGDEIDDVLQLSSKVANKINRLIKEKEELLNEIRIIDEDLEDVKDISKQIFEIEKKANMVKSRVRN